MRRAVVDASVLAAITFGEPGAESCAAAIEGTALHAPVVLPFELANAARQKCRTAPGHTREIVSALGLTLERLRKVTLHDVSVSDVLLLANASGLSAYDASYLWLAGFLGADLVTLDRQLAEAHDAFAFGQE